MKKIHHFSIEEKFKIICHFHNGELRVLDLEKVLDKGGKYAQKIFEKDNFRKAKIGEFGEIYWDGLAEIRNLNGELESCAYDISPEFAYAKSKPVEEKVADFQ